MLLLCNKKTVEIQFQTPLHAPTQPKEKSPLKKKEQRNHHRGREPESHEDDVRSVVLDLPGSQFTEEK